MDLDGKLGQLHLSQDLRLLFADAKLFDQEPRDRCPSNATKISDFDHGKTAGKSETQERTSRLSLALRRDGTHRTKYWVPMFLDLGGDEPPQAGPAHRVHALLHFGDVVLGQVFHAYAALERGLDVLRELRLLSTEQLVFLVKFGLELMSEGSFDPYIFF